MDTEVRGVYHDRLAWHPPRRSPRGYLINCVSRAQEMDTKYRKSKADLDELVSNMEGL